jgi:hypothetical protein
MSAHCAPNLGEAEMEHYKVSQKDSMCKKNA